MLYLSESGLIYGGDRQQRPDGSFDPALPDRPSPAHTWNGTTWVLIKAQNYSGFYHGLLTEALPIFLKIRELADSNLPVSNVYTDLMGAIGFASLDGFQSSIANLVLVMAAVGQPFTVEELAMVRSVLDANGFQEVVLP